MCQYFPIYNNETLPNSTKIAKQCSQFCQILITSSKALRNAFNVLLKWLKFAKFGRTAVMQLDKVQRKRSKELYVGDLLAIGWGECP